jgi:hypothetical protein
VKMCHLRDKKMEVDPQEFLIGSCWTGMIMIFLRAKETVLAEDPGRTGSLLLRPQWS